LPECAGGLPNQQGILTPAGCDKDMLYLMFDNKAGLTTSFLTP
jgi:hypothetical protein